MAFYLARVLLLAALLGALLVGLAIAKPIGIATSGRITLTLTDEPCAIATIKATLPLRATWRDGNAVTEGCWALHGPSGSVIAIFADGDLGVFPASDFRRVSLM